MTRDDAPQTAHDAPLAGRTVIVTRTLAQSAALAGPLEAVGARVLAFPVIQTIEPEDWAPADRAIAELQDYDWIVFTSTNAVDRFVRRLEQAGMRRSMLGAAHTAAVGSGTARHMADYGIEPDVIPTDFRGEGLVEAFEELGVGEGRRILIPRALDAREILPDSLREMGAQVDVVPVYRTVRADADPQMLAVLQRGEADLVTFTSPSTFKNFVALVSEAGMDATELLGGLKSASIGPVTSKAMRARGYEPTIEASESSVPGLVEAITMHYQGV